MNQERNKKTIHGVPVAEWDACADIALEELRKEKGIPDWLPTFHNRRDFENRVLELYKKLDK